MGCAPSASDVEQGEIRRGTHDCSARNQPSRPPGTAAVIYGTSVGRIPGSRQRTPGQKSRMGTSLTARMGARDCLPRCGPDRLPNRLARTIVWLLRREMSLHSSPGPQHSYTRPVSAENTGCGTYRTPGRVALKGVGAGPSPRPQQAHIRPPCRPKSGQGNAATEHPTPAKPMGCDPFPCTRQLGAALAASRTPVHSYTRLVSAEIPPTQRETRGPKPALAHHTRTGRKPGELRQADPGALIYPTLLGGNPPNGWSIRPARGNTPSVRWRSRRRHADSDHLHPANGTYE